MVEGQETHTGEGVGPGIKIVCTLFTLNAESNSPIQRERKKTTEFTGILNGVC